MRLVTQKQVAAQLGITDIALRWRISSYYKEFPSYVTKIRCNYYDGDAIDKYLAENPFIHRERGYKDKTGLVNQLDLSLSICFLSGKFDTPYKRMKHSVRLMRSNKNKPKTKIVKLAGEW